MKKRLFIINIKFDPAPDGSVYELKSAQLKVKAPNAKRAKTISEEWMEKCWQFYSQSIREIE